MCGIAGFISEINEFLQREDALYIRHRGPDDFGSYCRPPVKLLHYRLSILDLSKNGHQPMISPDGRFVLVYNGEVYNHIELRDQLNHKYEFKSSSDAETILYAYVEWGTKAFAKLNGIFALAIYDTEQEELILARDFFGIKPLYYFSNGNEFSFASEIKGLLNTPEFDRSLDYKSLSNYIRYLYSPGASTPFRKVKKLEPGTYMVCQVKPFALGHPVRFAQWPNGCLRNFQTERQAVDAMDELMMQVVERQMLSDVPVGFFMSGGIDSSLLVAMARKLYPNRDFYGFTISNAFENDDGFGDDLPFARSLAKQLSVDLQEVSARFNIDSAFDEMVWCLDEPQGDAAPLMVDKIAQASREMGIPVLLGGLGGDDVFSGYRRHVSLQIDQFLHHLPLGWRRAMRKILHSLPATSPVMRRMHKFGDGLSFDTMNERLLMYHDWLPWQEVKKLFTIDIQEQFLGDDPAEELLEDLETNASNYSNLQKALYLECRYYLPDHNLNYTDKMGMKHAVEIRVPYLDKELVEFGFQLQDELKLKGMTTKYILRKLAERYLPKEIVNRPKTGFGGPVRKWMQDEMNSRVKRDLESTFLREQNIFHDHNIQALLNIQNSGSRDVAYPLLAILAIQSWWKQFIL